MRKSRLFIGLVLLAGLLAIGAVACSDDDGDEAVATDTVEADATVEDPETPPVANETPTDAPAATEVPDEPTAAPDFEGGRAPVELQGDARLPTQLMDVRAASHPGFDRVVFEFGNALPGANIEYVSRPVVACGSGLPVEVAGDALLEVRMSPAAAHDDAGFITFDPQVIRPLLPSIIAVVSTCDFEGQVTWVVGLTSEADFNAVTLDALFRIVVDVAHP